jgi:hypothetical protein
LTRSDFRYLRLRKGNKGIDPILLQPGKIHLARAGAATTYQFAVRKDNPNAKGKIVRFLNHEVYSMRYGLPRWALSRAYDFSRRIWSASSTSQALRAILDASSFRAGAASGAWRLLRSDYRGSRLTGR